MAQIRRVIAFVVDDLGLSFSSMHTTRQALQKFVDEQMQEGDLVAIISVGRGLGVLQQFTTDRGVLQAAVDKLVWNPRSRKTIPSFVPENAGPQYSSDTRSNTGRDVTSAQSGGKMGDGNSTGLTPTGRNSSNAGEGSPEDYQETIFSVGTLGAVNFVVRGLQELPGKKIAVLFSDGFSLFTDDKKDNAVYLQMRRLIDQANRSSVVIYSLDARGLLTTGPAAADSLSSVDSTQFTRQFQELLDSQEGISFLAQGTGGFSILNSNDSDLGVRRILSDNEHYYLLGFDPDSEQWNGKFHTVKVKVKKPGLEARTRAGYFGVSENELKKPPLQTREQQILSALSSPFGARDVELQMTSLFVNVPTHGSFVRSLFHIDPAGLTFKEVAGGGSVQFEIATFTFDEKGAVVESRISSFSPRLNREQYQQTKLTGLETIHDVPIRKPGFYQFRAVLRDVETGRLGSASQFIHIPDMEKKKLALSGLVMSLASGVTDIAAKASATGQPISATPATRHFPAHAEVEYGATIYNATARSGNKPELTAQLEIYRDGKPVYQSPARAVPIHTITDSLRINLSGRFRLDGLGPGDYLLHLIVTDKLADPKNSQVEQWMDFTVR